VLTKRFAGTCRQPSARSGCAPRRRYRRAPGAIARGRPRCGRGARRRCRSPQAPLLISGVTDCSLLVHWRRFGSGGRSRISGRFGSGGPESLVADRVNHTDVKPAFDATRPIVSKQDSPGFKLRRLCLDMIGLVALKSGCCIGMGCGVERVHGSRLAHRRPPLTALCRRPCGRLRGLFFAVLFVSSVDAMQNCEVGVFRDKLLF
jgi:hypothetical protein